jgi:rRNA maturation RNase YbeY
MHRLKIETDPDLTGISKGMVKKINNHTLDSEGIKDSEITIIFVDKILIQKLKKQFFNIDKPTDVIAFRLNEYKNDKVEGEIYICLPVAKENAEYYGEDYDREISRLIIHGILHLIGHDDKTEKQRLDMRQLEDKYLEELKI